MAVQCSLRTIRVYRLSNYGTTYGGRHALNGGSNSLHVEPETVIPRLHSSYHRLSSRSSWTSPSFGSDFPQLWSTLQERNTASGCARLSRRIGRRWTIGKTLRDGGTEVSANKRPRGLGHSVSHHSVVIPDRLLISEIAKAAADYYVDSLPGLGNLAAHPS